MTTAAYIIMFATEAVIFIIGAAIFISARRARKSGAPFFPTPPFAIRRAIKEAGLRPGELFYDLGAGVGTALIIAEKEFGARATGFEISLLPYVIGRINLVIHRSHVVLLEKNFFGADLREADVIFCFLAIRTMQKVEDKIKTGLKPGARMIVYAFPLPTMVPTKTIVVRGQWKMFIYTTRK